MTTDHPARSELRNAIRSFVQAASNALAPICARTPPQRVVGLEDWRRLEDGSFALTDQTFEPWDCTFQAARETIRALPELAAVAQALQTDPDLSSLFSGQFVGSPLGATQLDPVSIATTLLWRLAKKARGFTFDDDLVSEEVKTLEHDLASKTVLVRVFAPLMGLRSTCVPIVLQRDLTIDAMTEKEVATCLRVGAIRPQFGQLSRTPPLNGLCAVKLHIHLPRTLGSSSIDEAIKIWDMGTETILDVVQTLRIFKDGEFQSPAVLFSATWPLDRDVHNIHGLEPTNRHHSWAAGYQLDQAEAEKLVSLWTAIQGPRAKRLVNTAARRFSYACERHRPDDKIVDLMIAAEALFLGDSGKAQDRGELKYRLALRAAHFIQEPGLTRRQVFDHMKRAYDVRSTLVHGGVPDPKSLRSPTGDKVALKDFSALTTRLLRSAILQGVTEGDAKASGLVDWDARILGSSDAISEDRDAAEAG